VVAFGAPLKLTVDAELKPNPFTVSMNAAPPTIALAGETDVIPKTGLLMVKDATVDVPPPGAGFFTVTLTVPATAMSAAGIVAMIWVLLIDDGVMPGFVPKFTVAPTTKPLPFKVSVNAAPPAAALVGAIDVKAGAGLLIVNTCALEVPPPGAGFVTVTFTGPGVTMSAAGTVTMICVLVVDDGAML
jgi:hypothetical protein